MDTLTGYRTLPFVDPQVAGKNLARLMAERGITQVELERATKIQQEAISRAVATGRGLSAARWKRIADALDVPVETIFGLQRLTTV